MIEKKPFVAYSLDEERGDPLEQGKVFTIRLNGAEYKELREIMRILHIDRESTALKRLAQLGAAVLHSEKIRDFLGWWTNPTRRKAEE